MAERTILLLGNPELYEVSTPVGLGEISRLQSVVKDLHDTLFAFRAKYGVGRAIAAPQIGVKKRLIYMHIDEPVVFFNPVLDRKSEEKMILWDDCMSFPELLVKVERHRSLRIRFRDAEWRERELFLEGDLSELLQHEYDHLDGILAVQRALDGRSFALTGQRHLLSR